MQHCDYQVESDRSAEAVQIVSAFCRQNTGKLRVSRWHSFPQDILELILFFYPKFKFTIKVAMLGDTGGGKTSFMVRYIEDKFDADYTETLGVNFMMKTISLKNDIMTVSLWDLGGSESFHTLMPKVCGDANFILFAFDLTQKQSLLSIKRWYKDARKENKVRVMFRNLQKIVGHYLF